MKLTTTTITVITIIIFIKIYLPLYNDSDLSPQILSIASSSVNPPYIIRLLTPSIQHSLSFSVLLFSFTFQFRILFVNYSSLVQTICPCHYRCFSSLVSKMFLSTALFFLFDYFEFFFFWIFVRTSHKLHFKYHLISLKFQRQIKIYLSIINLSA